ncbi:NADH:ubiquinone oxidoreductase 17.2 kDa subunit family protein (macronuclear) [Tetrahymena thermophila SB210]|uniref:NADH:ubiquinone oxidoreductase 17.2 kDa subunit family protein n=1 Tax=Tetrahymena thermophila (strain SB210) TaxID=312017 RepID=Q23K86_TETTS|nr:NADH:ubiquinone oxidoreductase 17.2 kDa subunit family protein [Tetrahymena thermophila SB210]EAR96957.3 NADH:ubiquinone oxidoreductase 17.2 kDa subunit family protein [Tetrahymena thermophila SB210]|eukprot:XP_001017202.3 NADH:ubiquinone oxidoreductase 17.2 kDa subunit family protein [Tetrahymena thermophila SB210]
MRRQNNQQPQQQMQRNMNQQIKGQQNQYDYEYEQEDDDDMDDQEGYGEDEEGEYVFENEEEYLRYQAMREYELAQQGIHLVEQGPDYEPTEEEIHAYAEFLGMNLEEDQEFFDIAREGLIAPLPEGWCFAQVDGEDATYFYCRQTEELFEENPNDELFKQKFQDAKRLKEIKKQRENPPAAASKKRSKLQNLIDQYSNNDEEGKTDAGKQNMKSQQITNVNISNLDSSAITSNKNSVIGQTGKTKNELNSLNNIVGQQTSKNLQSKQNSALEISQSQSNNLESLTNAKTVNTKNKLTPLEPLNEKLSKEMSQSRPSSNINLGKKESEYDFDEDEHAFLQSDDDEQEEEDKKSKQSSNLPNEKVSILDTKSQNSRPPSAQQDKSKQVSKAASQVVTEKPQSKILNSDKTLTKKESSSKILQNNIVEELEEVNLEEIQKQDISKNLNAQKLNPLSDKKPPSLIKPLEKKPSKEIVTSQKESTSKKNTLKDIPSILEVSDQKILESSQKLEGKNFNMIENQQKSKEIKNEVKKEIQEIDNQNIQKSQSKNIEHKEKEDFDKNYFSSSQKYQSVESQKKTDNSKSNEYNLTKEFEDAENNTYTYSKEESLSQDDIDNKNIRNQEFSPNINYIPSQSASKDKNSQNKKLIKIEENLNENESDLFQDKQQVKRDFNIEAQDFQDFQEEENENETVEIDIQSLQFEEQLNIQAYIEEKENELNKKLAFYERDYREKQISFNNLIQQQRFSNFDSVDVARKRVDYLQQKEKTRIREKILNEMQAKEDEELRKMQSKLDEAGKIWKEEENFKVELKVSEFNNIFKDKYFKKLEQHERIIKNLKGIISKNEIIYSQQRNQLKEKFDSAYRAALFQQASAKHQQELALLEKDFETDKQDAVNYFENEFERTKQLEADELQKQKINITVKQIDIKEIFIKKYYLERSERELDMKKQLDNMFLKEKENLDQIYLDKFQQELNQHLFKKQKINEQEIEFLSQMNQQKLYDFEKLTMKECDHKIKLLEIEHSRRLNQLEEQLRQQKGLKNNYRYITERQNLTEQDTQLQIAEINNIIHLKKQELIILKQENKKFQKDQDELNFVLNIHKNQSNLYQYLQQLLDNKNNSINHLKERQKQKEKDFKSIKKQKQPAQQQNLTNGLLDQSLTDIQNILINFPLTNEKLYQNKKRSKLWTECIKRENQIIEQAKQKLKYQKIYLKTVYVDIQREKEKQKQEIEKIKKLSDIKEAEKEFQIKSLQTQSQNLVQKFNEDVKTVRRNEELMRKRDEQMLQVEKAFNKAMNLGLDEDSLIEQYVKLKQLNNQQLRELKLVPNNELDIKTKINNYQDVSSYLDVTGDDQQNDHQYTPQLYDKFQFVDTEINKPPHQLKELYEGLNTPFVKGLMQQRQEQNQYDVNRVETLLKDAKYSQQIMSVKLNGFLQRREYAKMTENVERFKSEVSSHKQWFKDVKQYINQTLIDRNQTRSHLNTII